MHYHRAKAAGKIPETVIAQYAACKNGAKLHFFQDWINGLIPAATPQVVEQASLTHRDEAEEVREWLNWPELLHKLGGDLHDHQKRYCTQLWRAAAGRPERAHPDGPSLPRQRPFTVSSLERALRRREATTLASLLGVSDNPIAVQQLLACLQPPAEGAAAAARVAAAADTDSSSSPAAQTGALKRRGGLDCFDEPMGKRRGGLPDFEEPRGMPKATRPAAAAQRQPAQEDGNPPSRSQLLTEVFKLVPRLYAILDRPCINDEGDPAGAMVKAQLQPLLQKVLAVQEQLQDAQQTPGPEKLQELQGTLVTASEKAQKLAFVLTKLQ